MSLPVFLNGILMREGYDYKVVGKHQDWQQQIEWTGVLPAKGDAISFQYAEDDPSAVDQLAEVTLSKAERERRQAGRLGGAFRTIWCEADETP